MRFLIVTILLFFTSNCFAGNNKESYKKVIWPFDGIFGSVDRQSAQRGAQVYLEVCSTCHGLNHLYYRNLVALGFSDDEIKEIAGNRTVIDGPNDQGEMFERKALPADLFVKPYPNEEAARAANNGAYPVDLSLIIKSREDGANYLYSLLTGYKDPPESFKLQDDLYYNPYFEGMQIAMPPPLFYDQLSFIDNTPATVEQMARDVTTFLQWSAEPEMEHRKSLGLKVIMFLVIFTIVFFIVKHRIWKNIN